MSQNKFNKLQNARIVILGGTSGIGFAVAEGSLESGATITIANSNQERLDKALERLRAAYPDTTSRISGTICDISSVDTVEDNLHALFKFATKDGTKIDHIVTTARAPGEMPKLEELTATKVLEGGTTMYLGGLMIGKIAPGYMNGGWANSITFTGGTLVAKPIKGMSSTLGWVAAKEGITRTLAVDLAPVRVNLVSPGAVRTELLLRMMRGSEELVDGWKKDNILNEVAMPEDTAEAYLYLMRIGLLPGKF
ncbi:hypothetical protein MMC10_007222 [Thelotrema lepadinum]|nr:hypothetical protein [Thelotrema lepadinum]